MKRILAFILIFILLMSSACSKPNDEESAASIDTNAGAEQSNDSTDSENEQTPDTNESVENPTEQNEQYVQNNNTSQGNEQKPQQEQKPEQEQTPSNESQQQDIKNEPVYDDSNATPASDFEYTIKKDDSYRVLKKYIGNKKDVVTPNYIDGYPVKAIAVACFANTCVESIIISENIEIISPNAFSGSNLKTATIKSTSVVAYHYTFEGCGLLESVTFMYGDAEFTGILFSKCQNLKEIILWKKC